MLQWWRDESESATTNRKPTDAATEFAPIRHQAYNMDSIGTAFRKGLTA